MNSVFWQNTLNCRAKRRDNGEFAVGTYSYNPDRNKGIISVYDGKNGTTEYPVFLSTVMRDTGYVRNGECIFEGDVFALGKIYGIVRFGEHTTTQGSETVGFYIEWRQEPLTLRNDIGYWVHYEGEEFKHLGYIDERLVLSYYMD